MHRDHKGRIQLSGSHLEHLGTELVISYSFPGPGLFLWKEAKWQEFCVLYEKTVGLGLLNETMQNVIDNAIKVEPDRVGRVHIPVRFWEWLDAGGDADLQLTLIGDGRALLMCVEE